MRLPMASMLEGFVSQLLADYLSNYVQGIHPEQFRLGLWNGVAQLENVELRLEAFDYLQLPIAIKTGVVGRLKIQVPWKKLGREPILIGLEDIYICACPRDEFEWKSEALEARSLAAKKAKLAAAELAKLSARISGRISDDHSNQSFFSYLSTRILDNVQVIAENVHLRYTDQKTDPEMAFSFGIKFSHLTMNTEQMISGAGSGRAKANLVNKLVEIKEFSIYWNSNEDKGKDMSNDAHSKIECTHLIHPFNASLRLMVNKNPLLDGSTPQYSTSFEINKLEFTLEDRQLHEMLLLWDALSICQMREKYGRFRPVVGQHGYDKREDGWQTVWWHYAVQAVLVDVRKNLRRTAWSYLGWRINMRRKYVLLYKEKLDCLWTGKPAADQSLHKLEELEKELDLDEILAFRLTAESSSPGQGSLDPPEETSGSEQMESKSEIKPDDLSFLKHRSWLNYLSLGMLGAAGSATASEQFAGVLPDEIIEDISEATRYQPLGLKGYGALPKGFCRFAITACITGVSINLRRMHPKEAIASLDMQAIDARIRVWQQSTKVIFSVKTLQAVDQCQNSSAYPTVLANEGTILPFFSQTGHYQQSYAEAVSGVRQTDVAGSFNGPLSKQALKEPFLVVEVEMLSEDSEFDLTVKITMQPMEFVYSPMLMKQMNSFINRPTSLQTLKDLIFSSLDRLQSPQVRLQSKAELTLAMGKRVGMLIDVQRPVLIFPKSLQSSDGNHLIMMMNSLQVTSIDEKAGRSLETKYGKKLQPQLSSMEDSLTFLPQSLGDGKETCTEFIYPAIYNKFHLQLNGVQAIVTSHSCNWQNSWRGPSQFLEFHLAKYFDAEAVLEICALPDEPALTRFKLHGDIPSLNLTFSPKKWKILKSFFSNHSEKEMKGRNGSSVISVADELSDNERSAPYFKLELVSKSMSLFLHSEEDGKLQSCITLLAKGEDASLTFVDSSLQQKLQFSVASLHIDKALQAVDDGPFLSLHSASSLSVAGLFEPTTIWRWDWKASQMMVVLRGDVNDAEPVVVVNVEGMENIGSYKNDDLESVSFKAMKLRIRSDIGPLGSQSDGSNCHLCTASHCCVTCAIEQWQCAEILLLAPKEAVPGLEISLLSEKKNRNVFICMPLSNVNLHLTKWRSFLQTLSFYHLRGNGYGKDKPDVSHTADQQQKVKLEVSTFPRDAQSGLIVQTSVISIDLVFPEYCDTSSEKDSAHLGKSTTSTNQFAEVGMSSLDKSISSKLILQVKNLCYRESLCNFEASLLKCEVNLKDCINGSLQCLPLLHVAGMHVKLDVEHWSATSRIMIMVHSCVVKRLDIWCSHSTLQFLRSFKFEKTPQTESSLEFEVIMVTVSLQRGSVLLTDGRWNYNAPIFELRVRSLNSQMRWSSFDQLVCTTAMVLEADYHDMEKVAWEPFLEPWDLSCDFSLRFGLNIPVQQIDFKLLSSGHLNINLTKAFFQASSRAADVFNDAAESLSNPLKSSQNKSSVGYAPYWLQNDTGVRLKYWLVGASKIEEVEGFVDGNESGASGQNVVNPGCSIPLNIKETPEQVFHIGRSNSSSERLAEKRLYGGQHRMIRVQIEGTSTASCPLSMDLVGVHTFYVAFSHSSSNLLSDSKRRKEKFRPESKSTENGDIEGGESAFQMPVIYEVSGHYYSKIVRIYSTVSLVNATTIPMEVRFDIPFGVLPKVMEPIFPGEVIPLPVHLAETGQIRWRPMGSSHLWSETQSLSYILSASKLGTLRSFVSYPSNPSNAIFRCCIMVQESKGPLSAVSEKLHNPATSSRDTSISASLAPVRVPSMFAQASSSIARELVFHAPFVFKNCLPLPLVLAIDSSAGHHLALHVPECDTIFVLEANTGHDLALTVNVPGFLPASVKVASTTTLLESHKEILHNEITLVETICLIPDNAHGHMVYCKTESLFNMMSGAREISVYVPFWLYNHSGVNLGILDGDLDLLKRDGHQVKQQVISSFSLLDKEVGSFETDSAGLQSVLEESSQSANRVYTHGHFCGTTAMRSVGGGKRIISCTPSQVTPTDAEGNIKELQHSRPYIYSPVTDTELGDNRLKAKVALPSSGKGFVLTNASKVAWSRPFSLNPPGGMTTITIPLSEEGGGWIISVVSAPVLGASSGKTRTITFQPRFVLANICNQDLCYRQQGTDNFEYLLKGKQGHLRWSDMSRPLLVSLRFDQHGWDWSGAFVPDELGDTQLKMRNLVTGATQILRVEVQNAGSLENGSNDMSSTDNSLGTYLILLSDDESGFMPYRIENFSLERLRFFQSKCPDFESTLLPYSSCMYAWDEPWRPHQLVVEIPGEGCLGTFDLDDVREYPTVHVPATNQKADRWFSVCVHAEGPTRVLSFQDLNLHPKKDLCGISIKGPTPQSIEEYIGCKFTFNICCTSIGISVIDTSPQEILFATAKEVRLELLQSPHEQNLNFSVSYIQFDNQLPLAQYPVMVLAGVCSSNDSTSVEEGLIGEASNSRGARLEQLAFTLVAAKWRRFTSSVDCFQKIHARLAPIQVQLDEQIVSCLIDFFRTSHDTGFHAVYPDVNDQSSLFAGGSTVPSDKYRLMLDSKSTQLHLLKTLRFEEIYRCWPASRAVKCLHSQSSKVLVLARGGRKVYIESLSISPIEVTVSFSSIPWTDRHLSVPQSQRLLRESGPFVQRSLMALFDIEGAPVQLRQLSLAHPLARWDAIRGMIVKYYTRQLLHEIYKVLGSAGVLGNPMGFIKSLGSGVRDFVSAPAKSFVQSPRQLVGGFAEGTQSLVNNTVFAVSSAATLISRAARKGVTSLALGHQQEPGFQDYGVISELLEGLTGLLQSPVTGAERHGLPGILSGVAVGAVGVIARPIASILEVAGRTAQSIRSWSQPIQQAKRMRPPRYLNKGFPILPYSWEEAIGNAVLLEAAGSRLQNEVYVTCRPLMEPGSYVLLTERILLIVRGSANTHSGRVGPQWTIDAQIVLDDILHIEGNREVLNILMGSPRCPSSIRTSKKKQQSLYKRQLPNSSPLLHESIMMAKSEDAAELLACLRDVLEDRLKSRTKL